MLDSGFCDGEIIFTVEGDGTIEARCVEEKFAGLAEGRVSDQFQFRMEGKRQDGADGAVGEALGNIRGREGNVSCAEKGFDGGEIYASAARNHREHILRGFLAKFGEQDHALCGLMEGVAAHGADYVGSTFWSVVDQAVACVMLVEQSD